MKSIGSYIHIPLFVLIGSVTFRFVAGIFMWKIFEIVKGKNKIYRLPYWVEIFTDCVTIAGGIYIYNKLI